MTDLTVYEAFSRVMGEVQGIRKGERNTQQGFNFRGIDAVLNAVGPALRNHGVTIIPTALSIETERYQTAKGGQMQGVIVHMQYRVYGPGGDSFEGSAYGQASDAGDKAVSKAESVAYRTFLLQALTVPTDEPDPDSESHERAAVRQSKKQAAGAANVAIQKINHATNLDALRDVWEGLPAASRALVEVMQAKDARKEQLSVPKAEAWAPVAEVPE